MLRKLSTFGLMTLLLAVLLSACAPASAPTQAATQASEQPAAAPTKAAEPTATQAAVSGASATTSGSGRTFVVVPDQSEAIYEVTEKFLNRELPNQVVGRTKALEGQVQVDLSGKPTGQVTSFKVDLRTLTTDEARRDSRIRKQWLQSDQYPYATFVSTGVEGVPDSYKEDDEVSFKLNGNLTIHDVTKPVTFDVKAKLAGDTITGTATTQILMKDFGFDPPDIAGMLSVKDGVTLTVNFTAKEQK